MTLTPKDDQGQWASASISLAVTSRGSSYFAPGMGWRFFARSPPITWTPNKWYHIAGTLDADALTGQTYINGVKQALDGGRIQGSITKSTLPSKRGAVIWGGYDPVCEGRKDCVESPFTGTMDELRSYVGVALSAGQLVALMTSVATSNPGLVSYFAFSNSDHTPANAYFASGTNCAVETTSVSATEGKVCGVVTAGKSVCP